jgi:hypothetical protein
MPDILSPQFEEKEPFPWGKMVLILAGIAGVVILVLVGWRVYRSPVTPATNKNIAGEQTTIEKEKEVAAARAAEPVARPTDSLDSDQDGLYDSEEVRLGTNPNLADTDQDGLNDFDEIIRGTNPLKADTDGDGVKDGDEIKQKRNPLIANK